MKYAIDGSNALLGLKLDRKPSVRLFARMLMALKQRGDEFRLFFDNSIHSHMETAGLGMDWRRLIGALEVEGIKPHFSPRADAPIAEYCRSERALVINFSDKMDSWSFRPTAHRVGAKRFKKQNQKQLRIVLMDESTGKPEELAVASDAFSFGRIDFPSLELDVVHTEQIIKKEDHSKSVTEGTLLILALDASQSMTQKDTFDGRAKSEHLNEIVKDAVRRLRAARINEGLYMAVLRFENEVSPLLCPATGTVFASIFDWEKGIAKFDYLAGIRPGQTNIRLALQRSKELIQDTLVDKDAMRGIADDWRASVVLITDGRHYIQRPDGTPETEADVAGEALNIHAGASGLIEQKIVVGCVGIGTDVNVNMLQNIASLCSAVQRRMVRGKPVEKLLRDGRLFITVDAGSSGFDEAIRAFIDVSSSSG